MPADQYVVSLRQHLPQADKLTTPYKPLSNLFSDAIRAKPPLLEQSRIFGLVYAWEASELAILWLNPRKTAAFVDPEIDPEMLSMGKATTPADLLALLGGLRTLAKKSS